MTQAHTCAYMTHDITAQTFRVVDLVHEAVTDGISTTKRQGNPLFVSSAAHSFYRDIYYKDVKLFGSQAVVDKVRAHF